MTLFEAETFYVSVFPNQCAIMLNAILIGYAIAHAM